MMDWVPPEGYELAFYSTVALLCFKGILVVFLGWRIKTERASIEKVPQAILVAGFFAVLALFLSRGFYLEFDYVLTRFDTTLYTYAPQIYFFRLGNLILGIGITGLVLTIERTIHSDKTWIAIAIILVVGMLVQFLYPINPGNDAEFNVVSTIGFISIIFFLYIIVVFLRLAVVSPGLRKVVGGFCLGIIVWAIGSYMVTSNVLPLFIPLLSQDGAYAVATSLKVVGLSGITYGFVNFRLINKASIDYYTAKRICIVHRGKIQGRAFMCATCHVLYCTRCKDAVAEQENKCWSCKSPLRGGQGLVDADVETVHADNIPPVPSETVPSKEGKRDQGGLKAKGIKGSSI